VDKNQSSKQILQLSLLLMDSPEITKRIAPTIKTLKHLFAVSGNTCAFPGCKQKLFDSDFDFIAEVCHIEAAEEGGERFNRSQTNKERSEFSNLMVMCHEHHVKTDNIIKYPAPVLHGIKKAHEARFSNSQESDIPDFAVEQMSEKLTKMYSDIQIIKSDSKEIKEDTKEIKENSQAALLILKDLVNLSQPKLNEGDPLEEEYEIRLTEITKHIDAGLAKRGLDELLGLKERIWNKISDKLKFKILTNIGVCYHQLQDHDATAQFLIEAYPFEPESAVSLSNIVNAYMVVKQYDKAKDYCKLYLEKFPSSISAKGLWIKLSSTDASMDELLAFVPPEMQDKLEIISSLGMAAKKQNNLPLALEYFKKAQLLYPEDAFIGQLLLQTQLEDFSLRFSLVNVKVISKESQNELHGVLLLIDALFSKIANSELAAAKVALLMAEGYVLGLLQKIKEALVALDKAIAIDPINPFVLKHKGILLGSIGKREEALEVFEQIKDYTLVPDLPALMAENYQALGRGGVGTILLENFIEKAEKSYFRDQAIHVLLDLNVMDNQQDKVKELLSKYYKEENVLDKLSLCRGYRYLGDLDLAKEHLDHAYKLIKPLSTFKEKFFLAEELVKFNDYDRAIELYEQIADLDTDSPPTVKLYRLYHLTGDNNNALKILKRLREHLGPTDPATRLEIDIYQSLTDYTSAGKIAEEYVARFPEDLAMIIQLNGINIRLDHPEKVQEIDADKLITNDVSPSYIENYLFQLINLQKIKETFNFLYEYRRSKDDKIAHEMYVMKFLQYPGERKKHEIAAIDSVVTLNNSLKTPFSLILENRAANTVRENEINPEHPWFNELIGKKVGDTVRFDKLKTWTITAIADKYQIAYFDSKQKIDTIYSASSSLRTFHFDDFKDLFDNLRKQSGEPQQSFQKAIDACSMGLITYGQLAERYVKNPISLWDQFKSMSGILISTTGTTYEAISEFSAVVYGKRLCLDITALLYCFDLDIANELLSVFGKSFITESTYDLVFEERENSRSFRADGQPHPRLIEFIDFINKIADTKIPKSLMTVNALDKDASNSVLGTSFMDTMMLSKDEDCVLWSDDLMFRNVVQEETGIIGIWTQGILHHMFNEGAFTQERYEEKIIVLLTLGYRHCSIDSGILYHAFKGFNGIPKNAFDRCLTSLSGGYSTLGTSINVAYWFLFKLWKDPDTILKEKKEVTALVIMTLCYDRIVIQLMAYLEKYLKDREAEPIIDIELTVHAHIRYEMALILKNFDLGK
jgi:tetratricopeptide (TPR) repeat protein